MEVNFLSQEFRFFFFLRGLEGGDGREEVGSDLEAEKAGVWEEVEAGTLEAETWEEGGATEVDSSAVELELEWEQQWKESLRDSSSLCDGLFRD